jgi:hypothetical protein
MEDAVRDWNRVPCLAQLSFTAPLEFPAGFNVDAIATADFNHDGRVDVAVLCSRTATRAPTPRRHVHFVNQ